MAAVNNSKFIVITHIFLHTNFHQDVLRINVPNCTLVKIEYSGKIINNENMEIIKNLLVSSTSPKMVYFGLTSHIWEGSKFLYSLRQNEQIFTNGVLLITKILRLSEFSRLKKYRSRY